jgi:hypothetical protein
MHSEEKTTLAVDVRAIYSQAYGKLFLSSGKNNHPTPALELQAGTMPEHIRRVRRDSGGLSVEVAVESGPRYNFHPYSYSKRNDGLRFILRDVGCIFTVFHSRIQRRLACLAGVIIYPVLSILGLPTSSERS